jgi:hypothetical protein
MHIASPDSFIIGRLSDEKMEAENGIQESEFWIRSLFSSNAYNYVRRFNLNDSDPRYFNAPRSYPIKRSSV